MHDNVYQFAPPEGDPHPTPPQAESGAETEAHFRRGGMLLAFAVIEFPTAGIAVDSHHLAMAGVGLAVYGMTAGVAKLTANESCRRGREINFPMSLLVKA